MAIAGKVAITPKGEYEEGLQYTRLDYVTYNNDTYTCKKDCINIPPTNDEYWMLNIKYGSETTELRAEMSENTEDTFKRYYGLMNGKTEFLPNGNVKTVNSEAEILTEFGTNESGQETVTETITPNDGNVKYIKVTTFIPSTDTSNEMVNEEYSTVEI